MKNIFGYEVSYLRVETLAGGANSLGLAHSIILKNIFGYEVSYLRVETLAGGAIARTTYEPHYVRLSRARHIL